jgi:aspartyl-tRNA(Asn)/glutamyl-tRNA(Gln) amidotransferase subunit A
MLKIYEMSISQLRELLKKREISCCEVTESFIDRINTIDSKINAFLLPTYDLAIKQANDADKRIKNGEDSPLLGIPIGLKDLICTKGVKTTAGSLILKNFIPPYNATVVEKMFRAGAVLIGKLNLDEFGMGSSGENSAYKPTFNPWDTSRTPGGTSSGPAAAVASGECPGALGSDTGGSIREPASFCGVVGVKPTYGRVSRYGLIAFASSCDHIGCIGRNVQDSAMILNVISGHDPKDSTSSPKSVPNFTANLGESIKGIKIGLPKEYFVKGVDTIVAETVKKAAYKLSELGAEIMEISLPHTEYAVAAYYIVATTEASSNLARFDGVNYGHRAKDTGNIIEMYIKSRSEGFGSEVKRRIMLGTYALSAGYYDAYYLKSLKVRTLIKNDFINAFRSVDAIIAPVAPFPPFKIGDRIHDPLQMYLADIFTVPVSLSGLPAMSIPCGFTYDNLPIGLQIIAPPFAEEVMFKVAFAYEQSTEYHKRKPSL